MGGWGLGELKCSQELSRGSCGESQDDGDCDGADHVLHGDLLAGTLRPFHLSVGAAPHTGGPPKTHPSHTRHMGADITVFSRKTKMQWHFEWHSMPL